MPKMIQIKEKDLVHLTGFIAEALELIDGEWGKARTYDQLAKDGVVVEPIRLFMDKFKEHIPVTQAQANKDLADLEQSKKDEAEGISDAELV